MAGEVPEIEMGVIEDDLHEILRFGIIQRSSGDVGHVKVWITCSGRAQIVAAKLVENGDTMRGTKIAQTNYD